MSVLSKIQTILANAKNFGKTRSLSKIKYIVIHYTSNDGDTDTNNGKYFRDYVVKASAHYFVDSDSITQSVKDNVTAYSVGGNKYASCARTGGGKFYKQCTNSNSISIELCDDVKNGVVYPTQTTIDNALELTRHLMKKYNVPKDRVIRHFDVTGKICPAYWAGTASKNKLWLTEFWDKIDGGSGTTITQSKTYLVKITANTLNVRAGAGTSYKINTTVKKNQIYTIVEEKDGWGRLKSGAGWISLKYTTKI